MMNNYDYDAWESKATKSKKSPILTLASDRINYNSGLMRNQYSHIRLNFRYRDPEDRLAFYREHDYNRIDKAYNDLWITNQVDANLANNGTDELKHSYGWDFGYRNITCIERIAAERMAKTLTSTEKKIHKIRMEFDSPSTFSQFVAYICKAVNCKEFAKLDSACNASEYLSITSGLAWIESEIYRQRKDLLSFNPEWVGQQEESIAV